jgi:glycerol kinase
VFVGGAVVQWLRDGLRAISSSSEVERWPSVPDSGRRDDGARLHRPGRPYWKPDARGTITGLTRGTTWPTSRARRWNPSPTRARPCCRP